MFSLPLSDTADLRPLEVRHAEEFAAHMDRAREHIRPWVGSTFVSEDLDGARSTLRRYADRQAADGARLYGIWLDGVLVGGTLFAKFDVGAGTCEVGCWLEPSAEGRGLITRACRTLLDWAFVERGMHRAEWLCRADNERSAAVAARLGMTLEGVLREVWSYEGKRYDEQVWSVLASEWRSDGAEAQEPRSA
ncbi:RimJ/RimL family protein N-acetyltransferase [Nocardiopsis sp. Huas11]|uniref:GNAT family N-acetyltransferase n=1 Tax=Nocardiopsis sp. Huas11 TaxID=2183912 RepID=UPI000EAF4192|nr:GNAT family protein [Nocardiopsis sp. Huas11]RKS07111.1 RimJ/RimL family protein N-acetyltransferase [Nocardiopsis sp. Huas11]